MQEVIEIAEVLDDCFVSCEWILTVIDKEGQKKEVNNTEVH